MFVYSKITNVQKIYLSHFYSMKEKYVYEFYKIIYSLGLTYMVYVYISIYFYKEFKQSYKYISAFRNSKGTEVYNK